MRAYDELMEYLEEGEVVECVMFGGWGYGSDYYSDEGNIELAYDEPYEGHVPIEKRGKALTLEEAKPHMQNWSFNGGYGSPECYAVNIYTNQNIIYVHEYDGSTCLVSVNRNPVDGVTPTFF